MAARHVVWKRRAGQLCKLISRRGTRSVVLIYHAVGSGPVSLPLDRFQAQLEWLARNTRVVNPDELLAGKDASGLRVALTFDDGYACLARIVAPLLRQAGVPAAVFLNTACISDGPPIVSDASKGHTAGEAFLVWNEVEALHKAGWTIGSHGADHADLTQLPDAEIRRQLQQSKAEIEHRLGATCSHFAYTWGRHDRRVRAAVAQYGYDSAYAGVHGAVRPGCDRYAIPRIAIRSDYELDDFIAAVRGDWDYLGLVQRVRRWLR